MDLYKTNGSHVVDIASKAGYPASALSNFAPHRFVFDGVACGGMEGLVQAFKFDKPHIQVEVCKLSGGAAKKRGSSRNWQRSQTLWWQGVPMERAGPEYQQLLDRAYRAMFDQSDGFRRALNASHQATLTHSMGKSKQSETVLTTREFCSRLTALRSLLQANPELLEGHVALPQPGAR